MTQTLIGYQRERANGWNAQQALRNAKVRAEWEKALPCVRLRIECDEMPYDDSYIDTWTDQRESEREKSRKALWERIEREGVVGVIGEYFDGDEWVHVDSCWGFVGDDWVHSGYDTDIMRATLDAYTEYCNAQYLQGAA
jgi:hypothetical protein